MCVCVCVCVRVCVLCLVSQSCLTLCDPMDCNLPGFSAHGDSPGKSTGVGCHLLLQGIFPTPGIEPRSPTLQADGLPSEPPGKPKNIGDDSLPLLQGIFLTQESNQGLLHCRQILYQLRYQQLYRKPKADVGLFSVILLSKSTRTSNIWNTPQHYYR